MSLPQQDLDFVFERTEGFWKEVRGERFFITGGSGFFGLWFLETLLDANRRLNLGLEVTVLTRDSFKLAQRIIALGASHLFASRPFFDSASRARIIDGDVKTFPFPDGEYSHVIHAAVNGSETWEAWRTNVHGTERILEFAERCRAPRFLFLSSGAVYGNQHRYDGGLIDENRRVKLVDDPCPIYSEAKRAGELLCRKFGPPETKIARLFSFFGPYMDFDRFAIGRFLLGALQGCVDIVEYEPSIFSVFRSYMPMPDAMVWLWTVLFEGTSTYNVGSRSLRSVADVGRFIAKRVAGVPYEVARVKLVTRERGTRSWYVPETARIECGLKVKESFDFTGALRSTLDWMRSVGMAKETACV